jgi:crotonobetainyl-CoA:carnitine CoA-transferase CaiB-like acyl-CoA transferase
VVGILAALRHREHAGEGQRIEVNLLQSLLAALANQASGYTIAGAVPRRMGNAHPSISPYELYRAADGELALAVGNDRQFASLCEILGMPELAGDPRYATNTARVSNRGKLRLELERALAARPAQAWVEQLTTSRVPAGVVNDLDAAFQLAETLGLDPIVTIERADQSIVRLPSNPIRLSRTPARYRSAPPRFAELESLGG